MCEIVQNWFMSGVQTDEIVVLYYLDIQVIRIQCWNEISIHKTLYTYIFNKTV